jgi:hypothetical protein
LGVFGWCQGKGERDDTEIYTSVRFYELAGLVFLLLFTCSKKSTKPKEPFLSV